MSLRTMRGLGSGGVMLLLALSAPDGATAGDTEDRLQRLERQVEMIMNILSDRGLPKDGPDALPAGPVTPDSALSRPLGSQRVSPATTVREVTVAYYLSTTALDRDGPPPTAPSSSGKIGFNDAVSFDPSHYDLPSGIFSAYQDPARYSDVGVLLTGTMLLDEDGPYDFVLLPKPARAGGSAVGTSMAMQLSVDNQLLLESEPSGSWKPVRIQASLKKGEHSVKLWAVTHSPGYGPSPTASRLVVSIKGPRDASPRPLPLVVTER
ncbi:MAG: hypothetical protein DWQ09_16040 [Proteobacteria bacterium]|nr:MAG: hypothetical protein DWQ09_16040 [Pseudomonadota bacterium]